MDSISLVGITLGFAAILVGQVLEGGHIGSLVQPTAFLIVIGGTLGAVMLQSSMKVFRTGMQMFRWVFTPPNLDHDALIGGPDGNVVTSTGGVAYVAFRPLLEEFTVTMPREAAVIYPKDAAQILMWTDIFPGARVLEAGDPVTLVTNYNGIEVKAEGVALQRGRVGERIRVRNARSAKVLLGTVVDAHTVRLGGDG